MAMMKDDELVQAVLEAVSQAEGYDSDDLSQVRKDALDYYYVRDNAAPTAVGRSKQQSTDVADMVEAVVAQVMPAFEIDNVIEFEPLGPEDEDQAHTESDAVNYVVMEMNNGYYELQQAVRDALLLRNGVIKVFVDEKTDTTTEAFQGLTDMEAAQLRSGQLEGTEIEVLNEAQREDGLHDMEVRATTTTRKLKVQAIDVTMFGWYLNHDSIYLQDCPFCYELSYPTRSDLVERGYSESEVYSLNHVDLDTTEDQTARNQDDQETGFAAADTSQERVEHYECYIRIDRDGDGIAELLKVCIADDTLLEAVPISMVPFAAGTPFIQPHRFNGMSIFDKLRNVQDSKTHVLRQMLDNQNHANNSRVTVVDGQVNMDDVTNSRPGGVVRARSPGAVEPFPFTDIGPSCMNTLEYLDKQRSERGGASLDLQSAEMQIAGDTAHGVERVMTSREQLAAMITRTLAETLVRSTFLLVHNAMREFFPETVNIRARGRFATVDPRSWPVRDRVNVRAGLSPAERLRKKAALESVITRQDSLVAAGQGGVMVTAAGIHNAQIDWGRASGLDSPERYFQDPESEEGQAAAQAQAQAQQQQQQFNMALLDLQRSTEENKLAIEQAKVQQDEWEHRTQLIFDYWEATLKADIEEAKIVGNAAVTLGGQAIGRNSGSEADTERSDSEAA